MIGFYGEELPAAVESFIEKNNIGFVILFSRNIGSIKGTAALTNRLHALGKISPALYTDQEGGLVVRFGEMAATVISPMGLAASGKPGNARSAGRIIGREMKAIGIDGVLAPVCDVNFEEDNPVIGTRAFSDDPGIVALYAAEFAAGLNESGVSACAKHFPGHGGTVVDSHLKIPVSPISPEYFFHYCFLPFASLAGLNIDAMLSAHVRFPRIDNKIATFSPYFIRGLLREKTGFPGVVFSDCLEMKAVKDNFSATAIVRNCCEAGIDVMCPSHHLEFQEELFRAFLSGAEQGKISEKRIDESLSRVLKLKERFHLLGERRVVNPMEAEGIARYALVEELDIAAQSITLLRNNGHIIPVNRNKKCLLIEWQAAKATTDSYDKETLSPLAITAKKYLPHVESRVLNRGEIMPADLQSKLAGYDCIIACPCSLDTKMERDQARAIKQIIKSGKNVIVAAIGNPYDIRHFPNVGTYVVSYGFRQVQSDALFRVLTGESKPRGRLPVEIKGLFPRGSGLT